MVDLILDDQDELFINQALGQTLKRVVNSMKETTARTLKVFKCLYFLTLLLTLLTVQSVKSSVQAYAQVQTQAQKSSRSSAQESANPKALTLPQLTRCARANNPALKIAQAELDKIKSSLHFAQWSRFPSLSVEGLFAPLPARRLLKYCVSDNSLSPEGLERIIPCPNQDIQDDARISDVDGMGVFTRTSATLTQPLYTFGKISSGVRAAKAGVRAYQELTIVAERHFDLLAFQTYYGLILAKRAQRVFRKGRRQFKKLKKSINKELKAESGKYTSNDLRKLTIKESELITAEEGVSSQQRRAQRGVQLSCGFPFDQTIQTDESKLKPLEVTLLSEAEYLKRAFAQRPELRAARHQLEARQAQRAQAIAQFFPDLALVGTFGFARGTSAEDNPDPFANDPFNALGYGAYLGLKWRLNFAQLTSKFKASDAGVAKARAGLSALTLQLTLEINERYQEALRYQRALEAQREAMVSGKQWMTSTMLNKSAGLIDLKDALAAITGYFTTSLSYDRSIYEYNLAIIRLWATSGDDPLILF